ncbi:MAG: acylphosphatase [Ruminiclostridium sp.]|nr:acylphosphatase [Ruminiclostridium sp.]
MGIKHQLKKLRDGYVTGQVARAKLPAFSPAPIRRVRITYIGRVQKVGFRLEVSELAKRLGLTGFCQNLPDGSVLAEIQGPANRIRYLNTFMGSLKRIKIRQTITRELEPIPGETAFLQR